MTPGDRDPDRWWNGGVLYQIYPRSFADTDGDGVGDLPGIIGHLDHLAWLGVDGVWLSPGDRLAQRRLGLRRRRTSAPSTPTSARSTTSTRWSREAGRRGIRVLMDLVPNHTSDQHPWFVDSRSSRDVGPPGLVRVGRPQAGRGPAQQLGEQLRRAGVEPRRGHRPVLPPQLRGGSRTSTGGTRTCARVRRHLPLLVRPRRGRVPDRRVQHDDQGRRAPRQPAGHRGRPAGPAVRAARRLQHGPARGARRAPPVARLADTLRAGAAADRRDHWSRCRPLVAYYGDGHDELHGWRSTSTSSPRRSRPAAMRQVVEETEAALPPGRGRSGPAPTTTCPGSRPAGPGATRTRSGWRC